ncbi:MAG: relaxase/mobilization nuclease domain-containing protein, partial [Clostridia bacterium]|nr:relaxase/mobilization nuclease domain-containing protein [Clostridia bacterium]
MNGEKTEKGVLVFSYQCSDEPLQAARDFQSVRDMYHSRTEILDHHIIQAFKPGEVTPEQAHRIGMELCEKLFRGEYQFVLLTHTDKDHIHNHVIVNNTNITNGKSFNTLENKGTRFWKKLRSMSDELCKEHGLSTVNRAEHNKGTEHFEWEMNRQGLSWKAKLKLAISDCIEASKDFEDFLKKCPDFGIIAEYNPTHKVDLKFKLAEHVKEQPNIKFTRAKTLGWYYEKPQIEKLIILVNHPELMKPKLKYKPVEVAPDAGYGLKRWADIQNMKE